MPFGEDDGPKHFFGPSKDLGVAVDGAPLPPKIGDPLSAEACEELMKIVGQPRLLPSWKQGFFFAGYRPYGLQQAEGGPCGVLAVVQAFVIRRLLEKGGGQLLLEVDEKSKQEALVDALCEILWKNVGGNTKAVVLVPSSATAEPLETQQLRCLQPCTFTSFEQLYYHMNQKQYRDLFLTPGGCGIPLLLYSMVYTRGAKVIADNDYDDATTGAMIGGHGYCTQELVNLMVFGRAYSNVFDGTKRLGSNKDGWCVLQGAPRRPAVGFLSLFEAYNCIEVGPRYKGPTWPVWIVCAESHYTCLFAGEVGLEGVVDPQDSKRPINLYYFDQLARQSEDIRLTLTPGCLPGHLQTGFEDSESMIDRCIRTKWREATIDWNGSDKIL